MLARLMKYEIKSTARLFLPLYTILMVFALLNRYLNPFNTIEITNSFSFQALLNGLSMTAYFIVIVAVFVMTLVITIQRFYKNLLGDEGYLMFTLPVKAWQHIASKLLTAMMWCVLSAVAVVCSFMILVGLKEVIQSIPELMKMLKLAFGYSGFVVVPLLGLVQLAAGIMMIYDAIALGHLFQKHKLLASFGMYCILYFIQQLINMLIFLLLGNTMFMSLIRSAAPTPLELNMFLLVLAFFGAIVMTAHFAVTQFVLKRRLNLE